jgi:transcriptional regulator with XRE-family HTH domain
MKFEPFPERLCRLMDERGLVQKEFAKLTRLSEGAIGFYRRGGHFPGYWALIEMAKVLDVSLNYLMLGDDYEKSCRVAACDTADS